jgi:hypothetical protein
MMRVLTTSAAVLVALMLPAVALAQASITGVVRDTSGAVLPGVTVEADWPAPNAVIAPSLGRPLSNNAANATVNLIAPNTIYGEGLNQLDLRLAKILRFGPTRTTINLDIYNVTNANTILTQNNNFVPLAGGGARWQVPTSILQPRFFKMGAQLDW